MPGLEGPGRSGRRVVGVAAEELADVGDGFAGAPGAAADFQACGARGEAEAAGIQWPGADCGDTVLGFRPGHVGEQPGAGGGGGEIRVAGVGNGGEADEPGFEGEGGAAGAVAAGEVQQGLAGLEFGAGGVAGRGGAEPAGEQGVVVDGAEGGDGGGDIRDVEHGGFDAAGGDEGSGLLAALHQAGLGEGADGLVHGHAGAAIGRHQLVLDRETMARRPLAGDDTALQVCQDA